MLTRGSLIGAASRSRAPRPGVGNCPQLRSIPSFFHPKTGWIIETNPLARPLPYSSRIARRRVGTLHHDGLVRSLFRCLLISAVCLALSRSCSRPSLVSSSRSSVPSSAVSAFRCRKQRELDAQQNQPYPTRSASPHRRSKLGRRFFLCLCIGTGRKNKKRPVHVKPAGLTGTGCCLRFGPVRSSGYQPGRWEGCRPQPRL